MKAKVLAFPKSRVRTEHESHEAEIIKLPRRAFDPLMDPMRFWRDILRSMGM